MKRKIIVLSLVLTMFAAAMTSYSSSVKADQDDHVSFSGRMPSSIYDGDEHVYSFMSINRPYNLDFDFGFNYPTQEPTITNIGIDKGIEFMGWSFEPNSNVVSILSGENLKHTDIPANYRTLIENEAYTLVLYAVYARTSYDVTIKDSGLNTDPVYSVYQGETLATISQPTKIDQVFDGYVIEGTQTPFDESQPIIQDLTLVAQWKDPMIELSHDANVDPSIAPNDVSLFVDINMPVPIIWDMFEIEVASAPTITPKGEDLGVKFVGWSMIKGDDSNLIMPGQMLNETDVDMTKYQKGGVIELYAIYSRPSYTVTIKDTPDSVGRPYVIQHGELFTSLNYVPSNGVSVFQGYTIEGTQTPFDPNTKVKKDYTIVGNWKENITSVLNDLHTNIIWRGGNDPRPNVTISLLNDNTLVSTQTAQDGVNSIVWSSMPDLDMDGNVIQYNVSASQIADYSISYDGLNVIFTYIGNSSTPTPLPDTDNGDTNTPNPNPQTGEENNGVVEVPSVDVETNPENSKSPSLLSQEILSNNHGMKLPETGVASSSYTFSIVFVLVGVYLVLKRKK